MRRKWILAAGAILALAMTLGMVQALAAAPADTGVTTTINGTIGGGGGTVTYDVTLTNNTSATIGNIYLAATIPSGTTFDAATATPSGANFMGATKEVAQWLVSSIAAGGKAGPFSYRVNVTKSPAGAAKAWVRWQTPSDGSTVSSEATWKQAVAAGAPRRGCLACHVQVAPDGRYTLAFEAHERVEARGEGEEHPSKAPDGTSLAPTNQTGPQPCLLCHAAGQGDRAGKGNIAPLSLRDIVHPAHMFSEAFVEHYGGNCFTCHNVNGQGVFELLGEKVDVNEKGIPNDEKLPIPGALLPSELKK